MNKSAMIKLANAWRTAHSADIALSKLGYSETPYFAIEASIGDAICHLIDETPESFENSVTYTTLTNDAYTDNQCADIFLAKYCSGVPRLSSHVCESIESSAKVMGISVESMIKVILSEWALKRDATSDMFR